VTSSIVVRSLGLVALGAVVALVGERLVARDPADPRTQLIAQLAEGEPLQQLDSLMAERTRVKQDLILGQYFRLQRFRRFAQGGLDLSLIVLVPRGTSAEEVLAGIPIDRRIQVPRVALDSMARDEWKRAAEALAGDGLQAEVLDLRSLRPLDWGAIAASLSKTNRLVTVEEGWPVAGIGAQIVDDIQREAFDDLDAPIARVSGFDVPMHYARPLEKIIVPDAAAVVNAARHVCYLD
jgi:hypothetical protein